MGKLWVFAEQYSALWNRVRTASGEDRAYEFGVLLNFLVSGFENNAITLADFKLGAARIRMIITPQDKEQDFYPLLNSMLDLISSISIKLEYGKGDVVSVDRHEITEKISWMLKEFRNIYTMPVHINN